MTPAPDRTETLRALPERTETLRALPGWAGTLRALPGWAEKLRARLPATLKWPETARHVRIIQALPLGPGSRLLVVEFGGRRLLIGQARGGLVRLAEADPE